MNKNTLPGISRFVSMLFLIFEKARSKKTVSGIFRFVSVLFQYLKKRGAKKMCQVFADSEVSFFNI